MRTCAPRSWRRLSFVLASQHPGAEVRAIVRQKAIASFAQSRARTFHCMAGVELRCVESYPNAMSLSETLERNFLHRSAPMTVCEASVVNDTATADVYAVMVVERARSDEMRGERRLLAGEKQDVACIVDRPVHTLRRYAEAQASAIRHWSRREAGTYA